MRLDKYITERGLADSRTRAEKLIVAGLVSVDGVVKNKPSFDIDDSVSHDVKVVNNEKYVSRGGLKLEGALDSFNIDVSGLSVIDVGASTGGFTDCLLQRGAKSVTALDSGKDQLHAKIRGDERVRVIEGYNARAISVSDVGVYDGAVMDVSFISQTLIIPSLVNVISDSGFFVSLIKPQFEAGRAALGKGGIIKRAEDRLMAVMRVCSCAAENKLSLENLTVSPIEGGDGNIEYLAHFVKKDEGAYDSILKFGQDRIKQIVIKK